MNISYEYASKNQIVIISQDEFEVNILSKNEPDIKTEEELIDLTNKKVNLFTSKKYNFEKYFEEYYNISYIDKNIKEEISDVLNSDIETFFKYLMDKSYEFLSSDIHIIKGSDVFVIKFRINSILRTFIKLNLEIGESLVRIIKLKSNIDISKTLNPLEGRFDYNNLNYRISILPTVSGEKVTIRILGNINNIYTFSDLGLNEDDVKIIVDKISKNRGFILVTGSTGSGKSTTMFTIMHYLNDGIKNIISIEDPVEYKIDGVTQISLDKEKTSDFYDILKFVLRQDPEIINIGEIRDEHTAKLAISSANTGHLVFSTMHTNSSISSIQRLNDLKIENFEIANALSLIISQRLIRILCPNCKKQEIVSQEYKDIYGISSDIHYREVGCNNCYGSGYTKQIAIFEILEVNEEIKKLILDNSLSQENIQINTLKNKLIELVEKGYTSIKEISKYM